VLRCRLRAREKSRRDGYPGSDSGHFEADFCRLSLLRYGEDATVWVDHQKLLAAASLTSRSTSNLSEEVGLPASEFGSARLALDNWTPLSCQDEPDRDIRPET